MPAPKPGSRAQGYMARYSHALHYQYLSERIESEIADEQARVQYYDSLIAQENMTQAALLERFEAPGLDLREANVLLSEHSALVKGIDELTGGAASAAAAAKALPSGTDTIDDIYNYMSGVDPDIGITRERKSALLAKLKELGAAPATQDDLESRLNAMPDRSVSGGLSKAQQEKVDASMEAVQRGLQAAYFAGPKGIRGGIEGLEETKRRQLSADQLREAGEKARADALQASDYGTEESALRDALAQVELTGDPEALEPYLKDVYVRARETQAYKNEDRANFEQELLDSRKTEARLQGERQQIAGAYSDPRKEAARRQLTLMGYKFFREDSPDSWKNQYTQYQRTPDYQAYLDYHEIVKDHREREVPLEPTTKAQNLVTSYTMMKKRRGDRIDNADLRAQLAKAGIEGDEANDAIAFAMSYWTLGGPDQDPAMLKLQREETQAQAARDAQQREETKEALRLNELEQKAVKETEALQASQVAQLRGEQAEMNRYYDVYARERARGKSKEEASKAAEEVLTPVERVETIIRGDRLPQVPGEPSLWDRAERETGIEEARRTAEAASRLFGSRVETETKPLFGVDFTEAAARRMRELDVESREESARKKAELDAQLEGLRTPEGDLFYTPAQMEAIKAAPGATAQAIRAYQQQTPGSFVDPITGETSLTMEPTSIGAPTVEAKPLSEMTDAELEARLAEIGAQ